MRFEYNNVWRKNLIKNSFTKKEFFFVEDKKLLEPYMLGLSSANFAVTNFLDLIANRGFKKY